MSISNLHKTAPVHHGSTSITDQVIEADTPSGRYLGFTSDKFDGYLYLSGQSIYISLIFSLVPGSGNFRELVETILSKGYIVKVPTPIGKMRRILEHWEFSHVKEFTTTPEEIAYDCYYRVGKLPQFRYNKEE